MVRTVYAKGDRNGIFNSRHSRADLIRFAPRVSYLRVPEPPSHEHLCEFDQIAERVSEECELAADSRQDERLGHDHDAARSKRRDRGIHVGDVETEMVIAAIFQTVAEIRIRAYFSGKRFAAAEDFDVELVVGRRRQIGELLVAERPFGHDTEIELT